MTAIEIRTNEVAKKIAIGTEVSAIDINRCNKWQMIENLKAIKRNCSKAIKQLEREVANI